MVDPDKETVEGAIKLMIDCNYITEDEAASVNNDDSINEIILMSTFDEQEYIKEHNIPDGKRGRACLAHLLSNIMNAVQSLINGEQTTDAYTAE